MATSDWSQLGSMLPSSWMSAPKPLQPGDNGYTPPGMVSYSGEPPHPPYNTAPTGGTNIEGTGWTGYGAGATGSAPTGPFVEDPTAVGTARGGYQPGQYDQQINSLYAGIGKSPDLIDQQGRDFWTQKLAAGEDISGAFQNSATNVYQNMLEGQKSPYEAQNLRGWAANPQGPVMPRGMHRVSAGGASSPGGVNLNAYTQNPYLTQMGNGLRDQFSQFMNDGLSANRGGAVAAGGVGGSRQGIAEARTMTDAGKGFDSAIANLYGQDYNNQMNRNLQQYGIDKNYNLGLGGLDLQSRGQDMSFYTAQRGQDQSGAALGANLYNLGMQGPWNTLNNANGLASPYTGNGTTVQTGTQGGGGMGALGGILGGATLANNMKWWG